MNKSIREVVLKAVLRVCGLRGWIPHTVHVRSNHIHIIVSGDAKPERMMRDFKAYATRAIKNCVSGKTAFKKYWTRHGSTKYLWTKENLAAGTDYVKNRQGRIMSLWFRCQNGAPNVSEG